MHLKIGQKLVRVIIVERYEAPVIKPSNGAGRPRTHKNDKERQRAYRQRLKQNDGR